MNRVPKFRGGRISLFNSAPIQSNSVKIEVPAPPMEQPKVEQLKTKDSKKVESNKKDDKKEITVVGENNKIRKFINFKI